MKYTKIVDEDIDDIIKTFGSNDFINKFKNKTILITGASGMIGSYLSYTIIKLNELFDTNTKLIACVRHPEKLDSRIKDNESVTVLKQDVVDSFNIDEDIDYIIHAASPASPKIMKDKPVETNLANTLGTINTLKLAKDKNVLGYLFVSSREIYGEPNPGQEFFFEEGPLGQVNPLIPRNGYAEGKKAAENLCVSYKEEYGLNTKIIRPAHTYGPGMSIYDGRVQADFLNDVMHDRDIIMKSDGSSVRTYTYISDVISAIFIVLLKSKDVVYNAANIDGKVSIKELAQILVDLAPDKNTKLIMDIPKDAPKGIASFTGGIVNSEKLINETGWNAHYSVRDGFSRTIEHLKEELKEEKIKTR